MVSLGGKEGVAAFFQMIADATVAGPLETIVDRTSFPFLMDVQEQRYVMWKPEELLRFLRERRAFLVARGVERVEAKVAAMEIPRDGRFRAWVRWLHHYPNGTVDADSAGIFYLYREYDGRLMVEMTNFVSMSTLRRDALSDVGS